MTLKEMQDKRNKLITDAHAVAQLEEQTAETRTKFDAMMADVEVLEGDITRRERIEKMEAESRSFTRAGRPNPSGNEPSEAEQRQKDHAAAFEKYVRFGERSMNPEERALVFGETRTAGVTTTGTGGTTVDGSVAIPQQFYGELVDAQKMAGNLVSIVRKKVTNNNGAPIKIALSNDTGNVLTTLTAENSAVTEQDPTLSGFVMSTDTVTTMVQVSRQELADSYFDLAAWLKEKFGLRYFRGLDYLLVNGNGSNVQSVPAGATLGHGVAAATGPVYDDFVACYSALDPAYLPNAKWVFNSATRAFIMGQKDSYGRPLFIPSPNSGTLDQILGSGIVISQSMPNAVVTSTTVANTGVLYGDFNEGYMLRTDGDITILRLDERFADKLMVGFIGYGRLGGKSIDAGTHPILTMVTPHA